jgi:diguanylate cyclase (GGDEF)-like protein/PAS domain S-box-containing protein
VTTALESRDAAAELQRYLSMQALVTDLLSDIVKVPVEDVDRGIDDCLSRLGSFCGVDRAYVFAIRADLITNTHEWCAAGIQPEIDNLVDIPIEEIAAWQAPLQAGHPVVVDDVAALPVDRKAEQDLLAGQGIRSLLVTPMLDGGDLIGFVGFDAVSSLRQFLPAEVSLLRSVTDVISSALIRRTARQATHEAEMRLAALTRSSADLIAVLDEDSTITWASSSFARLGFDPAALIGRRWPDLLADDQRKDSLARIAQCVHGEVQHGGDVMLDAGDTPTWIEVVYTDLRTDPAVGGIVINAHDVTDRRRAEQRMAHASQHDPLTGLANRSLLADRLTALCTDADPAADATDPASVDPARSGTIAVAFVDLDRFKLVNDALGHDVGDALLAQAGQRLTDHVGDIGMVTRFGGDEFVVLVPDLSPHVGPDQLAERLRAAFADPFEIRGASHRVTVSVGIAQSTRSGRDPDALLRDADTAMYEAKARGRNRSVVFDRSLHARVRRHAELVQRLPLAVSAKSITASHQPIVDLATGRVCGSEALARWHDRDLGHVAPTDFIAIAEELGIIPELGEHILDLAVRDAATWPTGLGVSVNLSGTQLTDLELPDRIAVVLARRRVPPTRLTVEVTESILVQRPTATRAVLSRLRAMGVRVALDDFGTGYSSLSLLRDLPIDVLKVDRSFIAGLTESARDRRLVGAIIGMARDLGMATTAEGIETPAQLDLLRELGCDRGQGWLLGRPVTPEAFVGQFRVDA